METQSFLLKIHRSLGEMLLSSQKSVIGTEIQRIVADIGDHRKSVDLYEILDTLRQRCDNAKCVSEVCLHPAFAAPLQWAALRGTAGCRHGREGTEITGPVLGCIEAKFCN